MTSLMNRGSPWVQEAGPSALPVLSLRVLPGSSFWLGARRFYKDSIHRAIWASQLGLLARLLAWGGQLGVHLEPPPCQGGPSSPTC